MSSSSPVMLQKIRDDNDIHQVEHPIDKLKLLQQFAERDYNPNTAHLISTLLTIIDGLHSRICALDVELAKLR